jgi:BTB/POZ domain
MKSPRDHRTAFRGKKVSRFSSHFQVLSVCSPYFQKIFIEHPSTHPILFMTDVNSNHMAGLLDFMYSGQVDKKLFFASLENFSSFSYFHLYSTSTSSLLFSLPPPDSFVSS